MTPRPAEPPPPAGRLALLLVTPGDRGPAATLALARAALEGGASALLLREPQLEPPARRDLARELGLLCADHGAPLLVSRDAQLARACGASGVQAGWGGPGVEALRAALPGRAVGRSAHWPLQAEDLQADWLTLSPFRPTPRSHPRPTLTADQLRGIFATPGLPPTLALGGLTAADVPRLPAGPCGVAVLRALSEARDPREAARRLRAAVEERLAGGLRFTEPPVTRWSP